MSVIIRLQNLPWSANAMDIRNFFRGLSIPEGGVHIVGGEQGDAFIAFSTDEDARQAMMLNGGKLKEIQVNLYLSSRSEMHKVIEAARSSVPLMLAVAAPVVQPPPQAALTPFVPSLNSLLNPLSSNGTSIPGLGNPLEVPEPAVIEPPKPAVIEPPKPAVIEPPKLNEHSKSLSPDRYSEKSDEKKRKADRRRTKSRSRSRDRDRKDRKRDRRDRSRSRDRSRGYSRRDRSRSRDRKDRKRDRKDRSRSRDRSRDKDRRRDRDRKTDDRDQPKLKEGLLGDKPVHESVVGGAAGLPNNLPFNQRNTVRSQSQQNFTPGFVRAPFKPINPETQNLYGPPDPAITEVFNRLQDLGSKRNPLAFQGGSSGSGMMGSQPLGGSGVLGSKMGSQSRDMGLPGMSPVKSGRDIGTSLSNRDLGMNMGRDMSSPNIGGGRDMGSPNMRGGRDMGNSEMSGGRDFGGPGYGDRNIGGMKDGPGGRFRQEPRFDRGPPGLADRTTRPSKLNNDARNCCIVLKNAPNHTGYGDVRRFFAGHFIANQGIKMINDNMGRRTGTVFVRFADPRSKPVALNQNGWQLKNQTVTIQHLEDLEFDNAVDSYMPVRQEEIDDEPIVIDSDDNNTIMKLSDLPTYTKEHDLIKIFSEYSLLSIMLLSCRETKTKIGYVQFVKPEDLRAALELKEKYVFGRKQAQVSSCSDAEYEKVKAEQNQGTDAAKDDPPEEVEELQNEEPVEPEGPRDPRQRRPDPRPDNAPPPPTIFPTPFQSSPFPVTPFSAGAQYGGFQGGMNHGNVNPSGPWRAPFNNGRMGPSDDALLDCLLVKGLPHDATDRTILDFFSDVDAVPARIHLMLDNNGRPSGDCFCEFRTPNEAQLASVKRGEIDGRVIEVELVSRQTVEDALEGPKIDQEMQMEPPFRSNFGERGRGFFRGRGGGFDRGRGGYGNGRFEERESFDEFPGYRGRGRGFGARGRGRFDGPFNGRPLMGPPPEEMSTGPDGFGKPGCVVALENVPFRAGIDEILEFFHDFDLEHDDVIRRFNERGAPTGDARVNFKTPFDALRALKQKNQEQIRDRVINLTLI